MSFARPRVASVLLALAVGAAGAAAPPPAPPGAVLYKWVDAQGRTQYSDQPPKDFRGEVVRIESDPAPDPAPLRAPAAAAKAPGPEAKPAPAPTDLAGQRRALRKQLGDRVELARANLEAARKALAEGADTTPEERQVVQQRIAGNGSAPATANLDPTQVPVSGGGMHGMAPRSNCRTARDKAGKAATLCPVFVPTPEYHDRIARLEAAVKKAEEELAAAEEAYRRGVD